MADEQAVEDAGAFGAGPAAEARRWINEIDLSERNYEQWYGRCRKIIRRYKDEREWPDAQLATDRRRFATLWSNIEVLKPAVYAKKPKPVVTPRYKDQDQLARIAGEVIERALSYSIDAYDFDAVLKECRNDDLLCGIGVAWARYVPTFEQQQDKGEPVTNDAQAQAEDEDEDDSDEDDSYLKTEKAVHDHVAYNDFGTNKVRNWSEVRFVWRRVYMARDKLKERFKTPVPGTKQTLGDIIPLDWAPKATQADASNQQNLELFAKAMIFEVWDLDSKKVRWISKSYPNRVLDEVDDPLKLKDFFPCPRPIFSTLGPDSMIPVPDYIFYQDQAEEIDDLTLRIGILCDSLRMVGFYAGERDNDLQLAFKTGNENKLIPVDSWAQFKEAGGVRGIIEWVPIDMVVAALTACTEMRKQLLDDVYQITGISDIQRGDTDPNETKGAQVLKSQYGGQRVRERQKEIARFARDILNQMAEIIAEHFSWPTLKAMTNVQLLTNAEKELIQGQIALMQQAAQQQAQMTAQQQVMSPSLGMPPATPSPMGQQSPISAAPSPAGPSPAPPQGGPSMAGQASPAPPQIPPDIQEKLSKPTWEEIEQFLRQDNIRRFRIDVETDSTIEADVGQAKQDMTEFLSTIGQVLNQSVQMVAVAPPLAKLLGAVIKQGSRLFSFGRELEDIIDTTMDQIAGMPPQQQGQEGAKGEDPQVTQMKAMIEQMKLQQKEESEKRDAQLKLLEIQTKAEIEQMKIQAEAQRTAAEQRMQEQQMLTDRVNAAEDRQMEANDRERDRQFQGYQSDRDRAFQSDESQRGRDFDGEQNEAERKARQRERADT